MFQQSKVPDCSECAAYEENESAKFVEEEICPGCPHSKSIENPILFRIFHYINLLEAGCPVGRHELTDPEWSILGQVKNEWHRLAVEDAKETNKNEVKEINYNGRTGKWRGKGSLFRRR